MSDQVGPSTAAYLNEPFEDYVTDADSFSTDSKDDEMPTCPCRKVMDYLHSDAFHQSNADAFLSMLDQIAHINANEAIEEQEKQDKKRRKNADKDGTITHRDMISNGYIGHFKALVSKGVTQVYRSYTMPHYTDDEDKSIRIRQQLDRDESMKKALVNEGLLDKPGPIGILRGVNISGPFMHPSSPTQ